MILLLQKLLSAEKHPNADRLKLCHVDIGKRISKSCLWGPNAKDNLLTIYAPPGSIIPKNKMKLEVSKNKRRNVLWNALF